MIFKKKKLVVPVTMACSYCQSTTNIDHKYREPHDVCRSLASLFQTHNTSKRLPKIVNIARAAEWLYKGKPEFRKIAEKVIPPLEKKSNVRVIALRKRVEAKYLALLKKEGLI